MTAGVHGPQQPCTVSVCSGARDNCLVASAGVPTVAETAVAGASEASVLASPLFYLHSKSALWSLTYKLLGS